MALETKCILRPNLGTSADVPDVPSRTSMIKAAPEPPEEEAPEPKTMAPEVGDVDGEREMEEVDEGIEESEVENELDHDNEGESEAERPETKRESRNEPKPALKAQQPKSKATSAPSSGAKTRQRPVTDPADISRGVIAQGFATTTARPETPKGKVGSAYMGETLMTHFCVFCAVVVLCS